MVISSPVGSCTDQDARIISADHRSLYRVGHRVRLARAKWSEYDDRTFASEVAVATETSGSADESSRLFLPRVHFLFTALHIPPGYILKPAKIIQKHPTNKNQEKSLTLILYMNLCRTARCIQQSCIIWVVQHMLRQSCDNCSMVNFLHYPNFYLQP